MSEYFRKGSYFNKYGPAYGKDVSFSNKKLCFACTDQEFLVSLLDELSEQSDCYFVKYSADPRNGMYLGRCFFLTDDRVGEMWAHYKNHPEVFCNVQDDDFTKLFRDQVFDWKKSG